MEKCTLKEISRRKTVDMGQCMCPVNCNKKAIEDQELTKKVSELYAVPSLEEISRRETVDMGQCMCPVNCNKKAIEDQKLTNEVSKIYKKILKKAA